MAWSEGASGTAAAKTIAPVSFASPAAAKLGSFEGGTTASDRSG